MRRRYSERRFALVQAGVQRLLALAAIGVQARDVLRLRLRLDDLKRLGDRRLPSWSLRSRSAGVAS